MDVIKEDSELSIFYANLKKTGLDEVLQKKLPWKWTIFAPTDKAFKASPERVQKEILSNEFYNKSIIMDHMLTGQKTSLNTGEEISLEVTVSNKSLPIYEITEFQGNRNRAYSSIRHPDSTKSFVLT